MNSQPLSLQWPSAGSDMAHVIGATDWQATKLGAVEGWPASLRSAVATVPDSPHRRAVKLAPCAGSL